ncbi:MAG: YajQ family cyclic di-GMP-binding protein [Deltaproteobacteria bacterium]|nr:YajQ family cyclic di-GMP-binding protein [Deltaproteobacteria bacterium]
MPSFDVVSEVDHQEIDNALNQARKEITTRYDFKGSQTEITQDKNFINIVSEDDYKVKAVQDIILSKVIKRGIDAKALKMGKVEGAASSRMKSQVEVLEGISTEIAKKMVQEIKSAKLKVQAQIQDEQLRVTGKKRDDLQEVMGMLKTKDWGIALQFKNFRD